MAILTAKQLKEREAPEFPIDIGNGDQVWAQIPDFQLMVLTGIMPTPLLGEVVKLIGAWAGKPLDELTEEVIGSNDKLLHFVNLTTCHALLRPRVVMTAAEVTDDETVLVTDLKLATRKAILLAVTNRMANPEVVAVAQEFPGGQPRQGAGPDVPAVPAETV